MKVICTKKDATKRKYVPFPLGNGDLCFLVDYKGSMTQREYSGGMIPGIHRAGFRYDCYHNGLVPFGYFEQTPEAEPLDWTQSVNLDNGLCQTECIYEDGSKVLTDIFCHPVHGLIGIRKRFFGINRLGIRYHLNSKRMTVKATSEFELAYEIDTIGDPAGNINFIGKGDFERSFGDHSYELIFSKGEGVCYLAFDKTAKQLAIDSSFDVLVNSCETEWSKFWNASKIDVPDEKIRTVCRTAEYHLKISSTKWSIPIGIFPSHWSGRYFAFDEFFSCMGLLKSGHLAEAEKVVDFRHRILHSAKERSYSYFDDVADFATYQWETVETAKIEGAPQGFWIEHIFHMANIALESHECAMMDSTKEFLKEKAYPVVRACAEFFRIQALVDLRDGRCIIGKCTDLERLGPARENAFMTSCSAIATFRAAALEAEILKLDSDMIPVWRKLADCLTETLPAENGRYIPYPGCGDSSIGLLSGIYPYPSLPLDDPKQIAAIQDYSARESQFGNMYPLGKSVCTWYAGWKAIVLTRMNRRQEALQIIRDAADDTGCFCEIFEIYESGHHPWFTTAEGIFLQAVMEYFG